MIWIQFCSASTASPATTFVGTDVEVLIKVLTDPPIEGIVIKDGEVCSPDDTVHELTFAENGVASLKLNKDEHQEGKYKVTAMATKEGYHDTAIKAHFYYLLEGPYVAELDDEV